tara:strand:+ start:40 stop:180 length:141 start_codon:yes stop_codon:yes gene_type:complete
LELATPFEELDFLADSLEQEMQKTKNGIYKMFFMYYSPFELISTGR